MLPPPAQFNFAQHLLDANASRAAKLAYRDDERTLTYGALEDGVRRFAAALSALDIRREERVLLLMHDTIDWPVAFLGCLYAGVVPVAVNTLLTPADYAYMLAHSRAQAAFVSSALTPMLRQAMKDAPHEVKRVVEASEFPSLLAQHAPAKSSALTSADDIGFWLYSSGSTGKPKGTVHTHANLYWTAELYGKPILGVREDDVVFSAAKLFFAYGLGNALTFPLSVGATVVLMAERPTPQAVFKRLIEQRPTIFYGVPTLYAAMLAAPDPPAAKQHQSARRCFRRRTLAERHRRTLHRALRLRGSRRHRLDRDAAYLSFQSGGTSALRHDRHAGAGVRHRTARRTRRPRRRRRRSAICMSRGRARH